jgi:hypothetical protein
VAKAPARGAAASAKSSRATGASLKAAKSSPAKPSAAGRAGAAARGAPGKVKGGLAKAGAAKKPTSGRVVRRDGAGHLNPKYAKALMSESGLRNQEPEPEPFIEKPRASDALAENFGEEFVASATSGENQEEDIFDAQVPEERGGPFVETTAGTEFAEGTDPSNPEDAEREPFPTT